MDLSKLSDDQLQQMIAAQQPAPAVADVTKMTDAELNAAIAAHGDSGGDRPLTVHPGVVAGSAPVAKALPDFDTDPQFSDSRQLGLAGRAVGEGVVGGVLGLPSLIGDAGLNAAYYAKKGLANTGAVAQPDPANYGLDGNHFPFSAGASKIGKMLPDAVGLPEPNTDAEKMGSSIVSGLAGAGSGIGLGQAITRTALPAARRIGGFLSENPRTQLVASGAGAGAAQEVENKGGTGGQATLAGIGASMIPALLTHRATNRAISRANDVTKPQGVDSAAASILQRNARDPAAAIQNIDSRPQPVPGWDSTGTVASGDRGIMGLETHLQPFDKQAGDINSRNSNAMVGHLERAGVVDGRGPVLDSRVGELADRDMVTMFRHDDPVDVTHIDDHLGQMANDRVNNDNVSQGANYFRQRLRRVSQPIMGQDANGDPVVVGYEARPSRLYQIVRKDVKDRVYDKGTQGDAATSALRNSRREMEQPIRMLDDAIGQNTGSAGNTPILPNGGTNYDRYLAQQSGMRRLRDQTEFANKVVDGASSRGTDMGTGQRTLLPGAIANKMKTTRLDTAGEGSGRMTFNSLPDGMQRAFHDVRAAQDLSLRTSGGPSGSVTEPRGRFSKSIERQVDRQLPAGTRARLGAGGVLGVAGALGGAGAGYAIGPTTGALVGLGGFGLSRAANVMAGAAKEVRGNAVENVQDALGRARNSPTEMRRLLALEVQRKQRLGYLRSAAKQGLRTGAMGVMGR